MVIYLRHAANGTKVAISETEAIADEKNGWERFEYGAKSELIDEPKEVTRAKRPYKRSNKRLS